MPTPKDVAYAFRLCNIMAVMMRFNASENISTFDL